jgi:hypothetical protein
MHPYVEKLFYKRDQEEHAFYQLCSLPEYTNHSEAARLWKEYPVIREGHKVMVSRTRLTTDERQWISNALRLNAGTYQANGSEAVFEHVYRSGFFRNRDEYLE